MSTVSDQTSVSDIATQYCRVLSHNGNETDKKKAWKLLEQKMAVVPNGEVFIAGNDADLGYLEGFADLGGSAMHFPEDGLEQAGHGVVGAVEQDTFAVPRFDPFETPRPSAEGDAARD